MRAKRFHTLAAEGRSKSPSCRYQVSYAAARWAKIAAIFGPGFGSSTVRNVAPGIIAIHCLHMHARYLDCADKGEAPLVPRLPWFSSFLT